MIKSVLIIGFLFVCALCESVYVCENVCTCVYICVVCIHASLCVLLVMLELGKNRADQEAERAQEKGARGRPQHLET